MVAAAVAAVVAAAVFLAAAAVFLVTALAADHYRFLLEVAAPAPDSSTSVSS